MLQGLQYDAVTHLAGALALILAATCISLCSPPLGGRYVEESPAPISEAQGTTGGPIVKTFASSAEVPVAARVRTPIGAEVGATPTVLQTSYIISEIYSFQLGLPQRLPVPTYIFELKADFTPLFFRHTHY